VKSSEQIPIICSVGKADATSFWAGVHGFLKALVWPAFLVYGALKSLAA